jgi:hypothetical protein
MLKMKNKNLENLNTSNRYLNKNFESNFFNETFKDVRKKKKINLFINYLFKK